MLQSIYDMRLNDGTTLRERNRKLPFTIPIGALVEVVLDPIEDMPEWTGVRMRVVQHDRDCDASPIYRLGVAGKFSRDYHWFSAASLKVIETP